MPIARNLRDRKSQRSDLIGGRDGLISSHPPKEAIAARRRDADHYHAIANPAAGEPPAERGAGPAKTGYRPGRKTRQRRQDKRKTP